MIMNFLLVVLDETFKNLNVYYSCTRKEVMILSNWEGFQMFEQEGGYILHMVLATTTLLLLNPDRKKEQKQP
jgi:hypothetical protein